MRAREAMISNPFMVSPGTTLLQFILGVLNGNQTPASVVDGERLVGMVSVEDVFHRLLPHYVGMTDSLVHALHDRARDFYQRHGFEPSPVAPRTLMLRL